MENYKLINYANSFQAVAKLRLESISELMNTLGNPQDDLKFIHIAGTNGKGSVCSFLQNILTDAGFITGKYTSPNMLKVNERISVNGVEISDNELNKLLDLVSQKALEVKERLDDMPTQFEIWTAAAFCYFKTQNCDYVVLETGLGGEQDATNIIKNPVISVITRLSLDHTEYLGNTLTDVAKAKAGIIKKSIFGGYTVTVNQTEEALRVIENAAENAENSIIVIKPQTVHSFNGDYEIFDYDGLNDVKMKMLGVHQAENAALAIECARILKIDEQHIRLGIFKAKNPGRFDLISNEPEILFDGAHNKNGMASLSDNLIRCFSNRKISFIMGFMKDKDILGAIKTLKMNGFNKNSTVYTVTVKDNPRAISATELSELVKNLGFNSKPCESIKQALGCIPADNLTVICGSLYLYKDLFEGI